ncbi:MAG: hypothetical protein M1268_02485 [Patescibacteria group bacterium]|nr:hypothetical protein [Patescibacteria group bacterium]
MRILKITIIFSAFFLLFTGFFHTISAITQDLGRHILMGKIIVQNDLIPQINLFSYTYPNYPFINHHWLSEVSFFTIQKLIGFNGLLLISTLVVIAAFSLVFFYSLKKDNIIPITIVSILYLRVLFERTDIRPEIFSFLFLSLFATILYSYRKKFNNLIYSLIFIELIWVNTHIYFFTGIIVLGLFLVDEIIINRKKLITKHAVILFFVFIASLFVTVINPNGIKGALYPFNVFNNYGYQIEENQNIFFLEQISNKPSIVYFKISAIFLFLTLILNFKKCKPIDWMLSVTFTYFAVVAIRNFPLFVFATFIPFVENLTSVFDKLTSKIFSRKVLIKIVVEVFLIIIMIWQIIQVSSFRTFGFGLEKGVKNGVDFFSEQKLKGPIFNNFDIGSYLEYRLFPKEKVFVDGRPEAYPIDFFQKVYIPMQDDKQVFEKESNKYNINSIIFGHTDQTPWAGEFIKQIVNNENWKIVYLDENVFIALKNNSENKTIIDKFNTNKNNFKVEDLGLKEITPLFRFANFFNKAGWAEQEEKTYQQILSINPNFCPALYNLAIILNQQKSPLSDVYANKFKLNCK